MLDEKDLYFVTWLLVMDTIITVAIYRVTFETN